MSEKFKVDKKDEEKKDEFVFKVYMPNNERGRKLKNKLISEAKLRHNNKVWKVLERGMAHIEESDKAIKIDHENRIQNLEEKVFGESEETEEKKSLTFGGDKKWISFQNMLETLK